MKKHIIILILMVFLLPSLLICAQEVNQQDTKSEFVDKKDVKQKKRKNTAERQNIKITSEAKAIEQRKKEVEAKERIANKSKRVKRWGLDKNISQIIKKRNIP